MCLAKAWLKEESTEKAIMENVANISMGNGKVILRSLFGEEMIEEATVEEVDFTHNTIMLKRN